MRPPDFQYQEPFWQGYIASMINYALSQPANQIHWHTLLKCEVYYETESFSETVSKGLKGRNYFIKLILVSKALIHTV